MEQIKTGILMQMDCYGTTNKLKNLNDDKINYFLASGDFCCLLITFAYNLEPDQDRQNVNWNSMIQLDNKNWWGVHEIIQQGKELLHWISISCRIWMVIKSTIYLLAVTFVVCWQPLQTVWNQIRTVRMSVLIWIQIVYRSDSVAERFFFVEMVLCEIVAVYTICLTLSSMIRSFDAFEISCILKYYGKWSICSFGANASFSIIFSKLFKTLLKFF